MENENNDLVKMYGDKIRIIEPHQRRVPTINSVIDGFESNIPIVYLPDHTSVMWGLGGGRKYEGNFCFCNLNNEEVVERWFEALKETKTKIFAWGGDCNEDACDSVIASSVNSARHNPNIAPIILSGRFYRDTSFKDTYERGISLGQYVPGVILADRKTLEEAKGLSNLYELIKEKNPSRVDLIQKVLEK